MNDLPANRGIVEQCPTQCGQILNNDHILCCPVLNDGRKYDMNNILNGSVNEKLEILHIWRKNLKEKEKYTPDPV